MKKIKKETRDLKKKLKKAKKDKAEIESQMKPKI